MATYNKEEFQEYLSTKVAESTAKIYATDMAVCVKALEKIKLYEGKELTEMLEDFVSHKKAVKNYLQEEFLTALTDIGSNDSGLYDSLTSKAKHYLAMGESSPKTQEEINVSNTTETLEIKFMMFEDSEDGECDEVISNWVSYELSSSNIDSYLKEDSHFYNNIERLFPENKEQLILDNYGRVKDAYYTAVRIEKIKFRDKVLDVYEESEDAYMDSYTSYNYLQTEFNN